MKKLILFLLALLPAMTVGAQGRFAKYVQQAGDAPFVLVDKQAFKLWLVDAQGTPIKEYGIACAINYGPKKVRGDHKTPEGTFKINQLLNAKGLTHDFKDGKGPIKDAYGPWFLRLDVPGFWDIGIHGTPFPESIGTRATEGCIRLRNEDILELKQQVKVGTPVIILPDPV
jgi:lipoprotein-anchoring transpeptidase ErfK/SrfK